MEKAILKTLIYADLFDYPLKINEIHRWLIGKKANIRQVEKALKFSKEYYFLQKRDGLVAKRKLREKQSTTFYKKAKILSQTLRFIPWIKLVGISGGLALNNAGKSDDIDLFLITERNRLWISRLLALGILSLIGQRRKVGDSGRKIAGKLCLNILLEEDKLEQKNKDIFVAHEVLQMKVLWQRDEIYTKYLMDNEWAFRFLPNWVGVGVACLAVKKRSYGINLSTCGNLHFLIGANFATLINYLEVLAKKLQLKIMQQPRGMERIEEGALYFHPEDCRLTVLEKYRQKVRSAISP